MTKRSEAMDTEHVLLQRQGRIGTIILNRPEALNALTRPMCRAIDRQLRLWADDAELVAVLIRSACDRAFCAGGDVRAVCQDGMAWRRGDSDGTLAHLFFADEYRMNHTIKTYPKPFIALMDGITMGGGAGLSVHGSHRIATERTLFAMPETAIGLFPDIGASFFLSRLPDHAGIWLGLTGARIRAADCVALGLATHFAAADALDGLVAELSSALETSSDAKATIDGVLAAAQSDPGPTMPARQRDTVSGCFAGETVEAILLALDLDCSAFATSAAAAMRAASPTSLKLTLEELRRGAALPFDECLRMEFRLSQSALQGHDFYEGVRAQLVDKDRNPAWSPASLAGIDEAAIEALFALPAAGDLDFAFR